ncbi:MAG: cyanate hydratase, partial [Rhodocyclaceae bacterium]|nr:cyanate hydratase [Rhodocyclaceae bacterium]
MTRDEVTQLILTAKRRKKLSWSALADSIGLSKEWTTAALMGQMTLDEGQATKIGDLLGLPAEAVEQLQVVPYKGSLPTAVP